MTQNSSTRAGEIDHLLGKTLRGEFRIDAVLGAGGMARVYRAHQIGVEREVVVKVMTPPSTRAAEWRARFLDEARAASRVRHPGIVTIYSFGEEEGVGPFIAMEYVEGADLRKVLAVSRPMDPIRASNLIAQVCRAMGEAHDAGVVHRDLKPDNIMVETRDGEEVARVLDFGIAKPQDSAVQTLDEQVVGTPEYMAPEQARKCPVDPRMDVYSAGIILYELVFGRRPFSAPDPLTLMFKHVQQPLPLDDFDPEWPPALRAVLETSCAKDPTERYGSAREMSQALEAIVRAHEFEAALGSAELGELSSTGLEVRTPVDVERVATIAEAPPGRAAPGPSESERKFAYVALAGLALVFIATAVALTTVAGDSDEASETGEAAAEVPAAIVVEPLPVREIEARIPRDDPASSTVERATWSVRVAMERAHGRVEGTRTPSTNTPRPRARPAADDPRDDFEIQRVVVPQKKRPAVLQPSFE